MFLEGASDIQYFHTRACAVQLNCITVNSKLSASIHREQSRRVNYERS